MMETEDYKKVVAAEIKKLNVAAEIKNRIKELQKQKKKTDKGESISLAAIGRTMDPPVSRVSVHLVMKGKTESARIKEAIEKNLGRTYWTRKMAANE